MVKTSPTFGRHSDDRLKLLLNGWETFDHLWLHNYTEPITYCFIVTIAVSQGFRITGRSNRGTGSVQTDNPLTRLTNPQTATRRSVGSLERRSATTLRYKIHRPIFLTLRGSILVPKHHAKVTAPC
jgi:hypothetical protein